MNLRLNRYALVLAAGKGTRFKSSSPKVLHELGGRPMISYLFDRLYELGVKKAFVVVGKGEDQIREALEDYDDVEFVRQEELLGTGHAVMAAVPHLKGLTGTIVVLYGDTTLVSTEALELLFQGRETTEADEALLTTTLEEPTGYGRILRDEDGRIVDIIEEKEATPEQRAIKEVNPGFVCFNIPSLVEAIPDLKNDNKAGEYYLTDMIKILRRRRGRIESIQVDVADGLLGINDRMQLAVAERALRGRITEKWMSRGVTFLDPENVIIESKVDIEADCVIFPGVIIQGNSRIGANCTIRANVHLHDAIVGRKTVIDHGTVIRKCTVGDESDIGPYAHLKGGCLVGSRVQVGNFVELSASDLGDESEAGHLSYLANAKIGKDVKIGAGTIVNLQGNQAEGRIVIEDGARIGSNTQFVAPVTVHKGAQVPAGSIVSENISCGLPEKKGTSQERK
jgi:bifunctional UDP-N-acetylglucosamine pyrophosphorylase/glucosamine-1-phosphate N-acetyltransferase